MNTPPNNLNLLPLAYADAQEEYPHIDAMSASPGILDDLHIVSDEMFDSEAHDISTLPICRSLESLTLSSPFIEAASGPEFCPQPFQTQAQVPTRGRSGAAFMRAISDMGTGVRGLAGKSRTGRGSRIAPLAEAAERYKQRSTSCAVEEKEPSSDLRPENWTRAATVDSSLLCASVADMIEEDVPAGAEAGALAAEIGVEAGVEVGAGAAGGSSDWQRRLQRLSVTSASTTSSINLPFATPAASRTPTVVNKQVRS